MTIRSTRLALVIAGVAFASLTPRIAAAGTISIDSFFNGVPVGYSFDAQESFAADGLGSVEMSNASGIAGFDFASAFEAYCVELLGDVFSPGTSTTTVPAVVSATAAPMSTWTDGAAGGVAGGGPKAAWLYTQYNPLIEFQASAAPISFAALGLTAPADTARTALAMAIWEALYETDASYSVADGAGRFFVYCDTTSLTYDPFGTGCTPRPQGGVVALANAFLAALGASTDEATWLILSGSVSEPIQDFIGPQAAVTVPEPATGVLAIAALAAALLRRRARAGVRLEGTKTGA